jgi:hypothetical protein
VVLVLLLLGVIIVAGAAVWSIGPIRPFDESVALLALGSDGTFGGDVRLDPVEAQAAELRFPLILGIQNQGQRAVRPIAAHLSVPARYRLLGKDGAPLGGEPGDGGPLVRYTFALPGEDVEPDVLPMVMAGTDNLHLAFARPGITCRLENGVPVFAPAPPYPADGLARVDAFWAIETAGSSRRQAGTIRFAFDPAHVTPLRAREVSFGPVVVERPNVTLPPALIVALEGVRETSCGEPGRAEPMISTVWTTPGGRFIILSVRGSPRKQLFDLNGDATVDLEAWDIDGDGEYEARRATSFPIPMDLLPPAIAADSLTVDSLRAADLTIDSATAGPDTTRSAASADTIRPDSLRADTVRRDTVRADTLRGDEP